MISLISFAITVATFLAFLLLVLSFLRGQRKTTEAALHLSRVIESTTMQAASSIQRANEALQMISEADIEAVGAALRVADQRLSTVTHERERLRELDRRIAKLSDRMVRWAGEPESEQEDRGSQDTTDWTGELSRVLRQRGEERDIVSVAASKVLEEIGDKANSDPYVRRLSLRSFEENQTVARRTLHVPLFELLSTLARVNMSSYPGKGAARAYVRE